jgi:hypothetical protein
MKKSKSLAARFDSEDDDWCWDDSSSDGREKRLAVLHFAQSCSSAEREYVLGRLGAEGSGLRLLDRTGRALFVESTGSFGQSRQLEGSKTFQKLSSTSALLAGAVLAPSAGSVGGASPCHVAPVRARLGLQRKTRESAHPAGGGEAQKPPPIVRASGLDGSSVPLLRGCTVVEAKEDIIDQCYKTDAADGKSVLVKLFSADGDGEGLVDDAIVTDDQYFFAADVPEPEDERDLLLLERMALSREFIPQDGGGKKKNYGKKLLPPAPKEPMATRGGDAWATAWEGSELGGAEFRDLIPEGCDDESGNFFFREVPTLRLIAEIGKEKQADSALRRFCEKTLLARGMQWKRAELSECGEVASGLQIDMGRIRRLALRERRAWRQAAADARAAAQEQGGRGRRNRDAGGEPQLGLDGKPLADPACALGAEIETLVSVSRADLEEGEPVAAYRAEGAPGGEALITVPPSTKATKESDWDIVMPLMNLIVLTRTELASVRFRGELEALHDEEVCVWELLVLVGGDEDVRRKFIGLRALGGETRCYVEVDSGDVRIHAVDFPVGSAFQRGSGSTGAGGESDGDEASLAPEEPEEGAAPAPEAVGSAGGGSSGEGEVSSGSSSSSSSESGSGDSGGSDSYWDSSDDYVDSDPASDDGADEESYAEAQQLRITKNVATVLDPAAKAKAFELRRKLRTGELEVPGADAGGSAGGRHQPGAAPTGEEESGAGGLAGQSQNHRARDLVGFAWDGELSVDTAELEEGCMNSDIAAETTLTVRNGFHATELLYLPGGTKGVVTAVLSSDFEHRSGPVEDSDDFVVVQWAEPEEKGGAERRRKAPATTEQAPVAGLTAYFFSLWEDEDLEPLRQAEAAEAAAAELRRKAGAAAAGGDDEALPKKSALLAGMQKTHRDVVAKFPKPAWRPREGQKAPGWKKAYTEADEREWDPLEEHHVCAKSGRVVESATREGGGARHCGELYSAHWGLPQYADPESEELRGQCADQAVDELRADGDCVVYFDRNTFWGVNPRGSSDNPEFVRKTRELHEALENLCEAVKTEADVGSADAHGAAREVLQVLYMKKWVVPDASKAWAVQAASCETYESAMGEGHRALFEGNKQALERTAAAAQLRREFPHHAQESAKDWLQGRFGRDWLRWKVQCEARKFILKSTGERERGDFFKDLVATVPKRPCAWAHYSQRDKAELGRRLGGMKRRFEAAGDVLGRVAEACEEEEDLKGEQEHEYGSGVRNDDPGWECARLRGCGAKKEQRSLAKARAHVECVKAMQEHGFWKLRIHEQFRELDLYWLYGPLTDFESWERAGRPAARGNAGGGGGGGLADYFAKPAKARKGKRGAGGAS